MKMLRVSRSKGVLKRCFLGRNEVHTQAYRRASTQLAIATSTSREQPDTTPSFWNAKNRIKGHNNVYILQHNRYKSSASKKKISIEEQYVRKTPIEHILLRPGMYVGPTGQSMDQSHYTLNNSISDGANKAIMEMKQTKVTIVPALLKIFDEILVNASDNHIRNPKTCNLLKIHMYPNGLPGSDRRPFISIENNGKGIPIKIHKTENMYLPEMLFGHLLTGSNFNDTVSKGLESTEMDRIRNTTGGRHGYGAKLTNIFSNEFTVETYDSSNKLHYTQTWYDNMSRCTEPEISPTKNRKEDFTKITFYPDLQKLYKATPKDTRNEISYDDYHVMCRRIYDLIACSDGKLKIELTTTGHSDENRKKKQNVFSEIIKMPHNFQSYAQLFSDDKLCFHTIKSSKWNIAIGKSQSGQFEHMSFVNGICTNRGGSHVNLITQQVITKFQEKLNKILSSSSTSASDSKEMKSLIKPSLIKRNLFIVVNAFIENPTFDSQVKDFLSSHLSLDKDSQLPDTFFNRQLFLSESEDGDEGCGILEAILQQAHGQQQANLLKTYRNIGSSAGARNSQEYVKRQLLSIPKLDDAHKAGLFSKSVSEAGENTKCTLILTEGDSAKALAISGLSEISIPSEDDNQSKSKSKKISNGRDYYGVFPLRGKFLNVRLATNSQLEKNQELLHLCKILGLDFSKTYDTQEERDSSLRYGQVMLMTDQDPDGSHIKGLIINLFRYFWPALLKPPIDSNNNDGARPFLSSFVTPLLKVTKTTTKKKKNPEIKSFYSIKEYNDWLHKEQEKQSNVKWSVKYYKGLGTSNSQEAKEYFQNFNNHYRPFVWESENLDGKFLDLVFEKDQAEERRKWISSCSIIDDDSDTNPKNLSTPTPTSYHDFVNKELVIFSNADNVRSIPNVIDGLKPSQRKVLFACFKRNAQKEIKVAQLAGYCAEHTSYHHGEQSLFSTIIGMAQNFVGSNNINLLEPSGQFGTRLEGGKDCASPRYIFTKPTPIARKLFPETDDVLLNYQEEDGQLVEPEYYCPILPLCVINGSQGIGTGFSTFIPPHNPLDVLEYIQTLLLNNPEEQLPTIRPWVRGFQGDISLATNNNDSYTTTGVIKPISKTSLRISELPINVWTNKYKQDVLLKMRDKGMIKSFVENHTTTEVLFDVKLQAAQMRRYCGEGDGKLEKKFKLHSSLSLSNMHAFFSPHFDGSSYPKILKFSKPKDIISTYFPTRLHFYNLRKTNIENTLEHNSTLLKNKLRFIEGISNGTIDIVQKQRSKKDAELILKEEFGFDEMSHIASIKRKGSSKNESNLSSSYLDDIEDENDGSGEYFSNRYSGKEYDYLLNMPLSSLTKEKLNKLGKEAKDAKRELKVIQNATPEDLWMQDLHDLEPILKETMDNGAT